MARQFMKTIASFLRVGGHFIATLSDCDVVKHIIRSRSYHQDEMYVWRVRTMGVVDCRIRSAGSE